MQQPRWWRTSASEVPRFRFCDDAGADGFGWIVDEAMTRTSHALAADGKVWLVDALDWPDAIARARELGEPAGVVQLLDRHDRDCAALAQRLGVAHVVAPDDLPGSPFVFVPIMRRKRWRESALWWPDDSDARRRRRARDEPLLHRRAGVTRRAPVLAPHAAQGTRCLRARANSRRTRRGGRRDGRRRLAAPCARGQQTTPAGRTPAHAVRGRGEIYLAPTCSPRAPGAPAVRARRGLRPSQAG